MRFILGVVFCIVIFGMETSRNQAYAQSNRNSELFNVQYDPSKKLLCFTLTSYQVLRNDGSEIYPNGKDTGRTKRCFKAESAEAIFAVLNGHVPSGSSDLSSLTIPINEVRDAVNNLKVQSETSHTASQLKFDELIGQIHSSETRIISKLDETIGSGGNVFPNPTTTFESTIGHKFRAVDFGGQVGLHTICASNAPNASHTLRIVPYLGDSPRKAIDLIPNPSTTTSASSQKCVNILATSVSIDPLKKGSATERLTIDVKITSQVIR